MRRKLVFFERWSDPVAEQILAEEPSIELVRLSLKDSPERIWQALGEAHGYQWPRGQYLGNRDVIERCPNLLAMSSQGAGYEMIDPVACTEAGVMVVNQTGPGREAVAEHVIGMAICLLKQIIQSDRALRRDRAWDRVDFKGEDIYGKTIGIVGFGNIGTRLGEVARAAFAMPVLAYDPYLSGEAIAARGGRKVDLDTLLRESDVVSINCPLTPETSGLIGAREIGLLKPSAILITTARGGITDEAALATALAEKRLAGAGLDVWDPEPPVLDHPLLKFDNVIVSPHIAGVTVQGYRGLAEVAARQWIQIFRGERPPRLQNPEVWDRYRERYRRIMGEAVRE